MIKRLLILFFCCYALSAGATDRQLLVFGDSLSAGFGIPIERGWVTLLQERLTAQGYNYHVINASISGDTSRGARARFDKLLSRVNPEIAILELGGNDGLRGIALDEVYANLSWMIKKFKENKTNVLLIPIQLPPNYGQAYIRKFQQVYERLAEEHGVIRSRFILDGIALNKSLMQGDGIHPLAEAQIMMLDNIWPTLKPMLK